MEIQIPKPASSATASGNPSLDPAYREVGRRMQALVFMKSVTPLASLAAP